MFNCREDREEEDREEEDREEEEAESPRLFNSLNISRFNISFNAGKLTDNLLANRCILRIL